MIRKVPSNISPLPLTWIQRLVQPPLLYLLLLLTVRQAGHLIKEAIENLDEDEEDEYSGDAEENRFLDH